MKSTEILLQEYYMDYVQGMTELFDRTLKQGVTSVNSNETLVNPIRNERRHQCICKNICACPGRVMSHINMENPWVNRFTLQALLGATKYSKELYNQCWPLPTSYMESPHIVSSSDQVIHSVSNMGGKNQDERTTPSPVSPPVTTSSQVKKKSNDAKGKVNNKGRKYVCKVCNHAFSYKHVLQNHERTHTGEKPFACTQCDKRFTRDHHLKTHMRLHTGEKPYMCSHCSKKFVQVANLRRHTRTHTGERPYQCTICSSKFSDSNQLKAHLMIHTGKKPFKCEFCKGTYRRKHHLNNHKCAQNVTGNETVITDEETKFESDSTSSDSSKARVPVGWMEGSTPSTVLSPMISPPVISPPMISPPEQTEPEDLSVKKIHHSNNNNDSSGPDISS